MSEKLKESLSAVIDGEADEFELRRVLDEVGKDVALQKSWDRYHLIGSVMRGERLVGTHAMRERIWAELQGEEPLPVTESAPDRPSDRSPRTPRWAAVAVAATVVTAVVIGYVQIGDPDEATTPAVAALDETSPGVGKNVVDVGGEPILQTEVSLKDQPGMAAYWVYHNQNLGMNQSGFGGFVRMVSYDPR
jgi:sigma-E factor negative regulatory protein RseA